MVADTSRSGSRFAVDLGDIRLPEVVERQIESEIRGVVLRVLAASDYRGDRRLQGSIFGRFPGHTLGLWLDPIDPDTPTIDSRQGAGADVSFTVKDHTLLVRAAMEHPFQVIRNLDHKPGAPEPSPTEILEAMLLVNEIDQQVKARVRVALELLPMLEEAESLVPALLRQEQKAMKRRLAKMPRESQSDALRKLADEYSEKDEVVLAEALITAAEIVEDGASTIYSPSFGFYEMLGNGQTVTIAEKDTVDTIEQIDKFGAVAGACAGAFVPLIGVPAGGAVAGAGASVGATIAAVWEWFWD